MNLLNWEIRMVLVDYWSSIPRIVKDYLRGRIGTDSYVLYVKRSI